MPYNPHVCTEKKPCIGRENLEKVLGYKIVWDPDNEGFLVVGDLEIPIIYCPWCSRKIQPDGSDPPPRT